MAAHAGSGGEMDVCGNWIALVNLKHRPVDAPDLPRDLLQTMEYVGAPASALYTAFQRLPGKVVQKAFSEGWPSMKKRAKTSSSTSRRWRAPKVRLY